MQYCLRQTLRAAFGATCLLTSAIVVADTTREEAIRANSVGTGVADKAIEQDRANRVENSQHNEVGNATNFLNNLNARQQQRDAREAEREGQRQKQFANLEDAYNAITRNGMQFVDDIKARNPIDWRRPNAGDDAWVALQYCIKKWERYGDDERRQTMECEVARAKLVLGLNGGGGYKPDPKAAIKEFKSLLKVDRKEQTKADPDWPALGAEILHYMGDAYLIGLEFKESKIKQDYDQAREFYEQSAHYGALERGDMYSVPYQVNSYYRLIEMYNLGLGVEKDPAKVQALAKEVAERVAACPDDYARGYALTNAPEWEQVKDIVSPYMKK